jgi:hypothetical protein
MVTTVRQRFLPATGALFVLLICVGNSMSTAGTTQSAHPTGRQVLADLRRQTGAAVPTVGFLLEVLGFAVFLLFLGYLASALTTGSGRRVVTPAAGTALVSGITMLAIKLGSAAPVLALGVDERGMSPQLARVLADLNGSAFVVSWLPMALFVAGTAVALRQAGLVGRPTSWVGLAVGVVGVPVAIAGFLDPAGANPVPFLLALLWVLATSVRLAVRRDQGIAMPVPGRRVLDAAAEPARTTTSVPS